MLVLCLGTASAHQLPVVPLPPCPWRHQFHSNWPEPLASTLAGIFDVLLAQSRVHLLSQAESMVGGRKVAAFHKQSVIRLHVVPARSQAVGRERQVELG